VALSRRKKIVFALAAMSLAAIGGLLMLLLADLVLHRRAERSAGLNRNGYRGPVAARKQANELRVVMLGGSTVFGYGVPWSESVPVQLEQQLRPRLTRPVTVVNLGFNNEGAFAFAPNLEDFAYLDYDVIVLYEGYNDLPGDDSVNHAVYRRDSAVYRLTGYFPILPLYLDEKAKMLRYGGDLNLAYQAERDKLRGENTVVFTPTLAQRTSAGTLDAIAAMTRALDGRLEKTASAAPIVKRESALGCEFPYVTFCDSVAAAVRFGRARDKAVVVGIQPHLPGGRSVELHRRQREMLAGMLARNFGADTRVILADLFELIDLENPELTFDAMHLSPKGNRLVADALVEPILKAAAAVGLQP
jgi:GDSL-like lipase/acylhydrolase family protein